MLLDTFVELFWKLQLLQVFVAILWPPCLGDNTSIFDTRLNCLLLHGHFVPLQENNRCCDVPLALWASIPESKRCTFYSSHIPDGNHSRSPRCQCAKANEEALAVTIVPGASISSCREITGCASFAHWLGVSYLWRMPVSFVGYVLEVSELVFIHCKNCLWTLSGWNLSWKGLLLKWGHVGYVLSVWYLITCSFCDNCPHRVHILLMLINGCKTLFTQGKFSIRYVCFV